MRTQLIVIEFKRNPLAKDDTATLQVTAQIHNSHHLLSIGRIGVYYDSETHTIEAETAS